MHVLMVFGIGHVLQEAASNGIPEVPNHGEVEGRRSTRDARRNWSGSTWTEAMIGLRIRYLYNRNGYTA